VVAVVRVAEGAAHPAFDLRTNVPIWNDMTSRRNRPRACDRWLVVTECAASAIDVQSAATGPAAAPDRSKPFSRVTARPTLRPSAPRSRRTCDSVDREVFFRFFAAEALMSVSG